MEQYLVQLPPVALLEMIVSQEDWAQFLYPSCMREIDEESLPVFLEPVKIS